MDAQERIARAQAAAPELIAKRVAETIRDVFHREDEPSPDTTIKALGLDSLEAVELTIAIEEEFDLAEEIPDEEALALCETGTVGDLAKLVQTKLAVASA